MKKLVQAIAIVAAVLLPSVAMATQQAYNTTHTPWAIASSGTTTINALNFDSGGEGVSWHDDPGLDSVAMYTQTIRADTDVEVAPTQDAIAWSYPGDWIEYTINVTQAGTYTFQAREGEGFDGRTIQATFRDASTDAVLADTGFLDVTNNGDFAYHVLGNTATVTLQAGIQVVRITFGGGQHQDFESFNLTRTVANHAPVAVDDNLATAAPVTFDPRFNDSDVDAGDTLTIIDVGTASHGEAHNNGNSVRYTPTAGYTGSDHFTYTLSDSHGGTAMATVYVTVSVAAGQKAYNPTQTPWVVANSGTTTINALNFDSGGMNVSWYDDPGLDSVAMYTQTIRADTDVEVAPTQDAIAWSYPGDWIEYTINVAQAGTYTFQPREGEGFDGRTIQATFEKDGTFYADAGVLDVPNNGDFAYHVLGNTATVDLRAGVQVIRITFGGGQHQDFESFNLTPTGNFAPVAVDDDMTTDYSTAKALDPRTNDSDPNSDSLTVMGVGLAAHGTATYSATSVTYTPTSGYTGSDSFTYTISDGHGSTAGAKVTVAVTAPVSTNSPPTASDDNWTTALNTSFSLDPRSNDLDVDGDALTVTGVSLASHGTTDHDGASVTYTPAHDYSGPDSFTYTISDGHSHTATATVNVTVSPASSGEKVLSVTQISYDADWRPSCTVVRMNPATFASPPADACTLGTPGDYGNDRITRTQYFDNGQVKEIDQAYGITIANGFRSDIQRAYASYTYTDNGLKETETDARGNKTKYRYDNFDRLSEVQYPTNDVSQSGTVNSDDHELFGYDDNGNKTSWQRRNGKIITYEYDRLNRQTKMDVPISTGNANGTDMDVYTGYDALGRVVYRKFGSETGPGISYSYDGLGRLTSSQDMAGHNVGYQYNIASQRTALTFHDNVSQTYAYDAGNRLTATRVSGVAANFAYDNLGRVIGMGRSNGTSSALGYDAQSRVTGLSHNLAGTANDAAWTFGYNPASQVVSQTGTALYDYKETADSELGYTFNGLNQDSGVAATEGGTGFDANGNLQKDGSRVMTYDVFNRLLSVTGTGVNLTLSYDPEGRLAKTVSSTGGTTVFYYDGTNLIGEYDGSGALLRRYMFTLGVDQPWVQFSNSGTALTDAKFLYANYQGSIIALADGSGSVSTADVYNYGAYGEPRNASNAENWLGSRFRYTGQTVLPEARLYYYKARVYDPVMGRFLQTDPIGSQDDLDLYAYTAGDPVNHGDPSGLAGQGAIPIQVPFPIPLFTPTDNSLADALDDAWHERQVKVYVTYTRFNPLTLQVYSGRTSFWTFADNLKYDSIMRMEAQDAVNSRLKAKDHKAKEDYGPGILDQYSPNYIAIKGREQMLIDFHGGSQKDGGTSGNIIRGVAPGAASYIAKAAAIGQFGDLPNNNPKDKEKKWIRK